MIPESTNKISAIGAPSSAIPVGGTSAKAKGGGNQEAEALTFSRHLNDRINRRKLEFSTDKLNRLTQAVDRVAGKGAHDSVVLLDNLAVLVNVTKRTVLTAIETEKMKDGIFTNIDSVVVG